MTSNPDPRTLDKNRTSGQDLGPDTETQVEEPSQTPEQTFVTYRQPYIDYVEGQPVQSFKIHGPIPSEEWPAYEKENGL